MPRYCLAILAVPASALFGQGTDLGAIRGVITDRTGSTVPGVTVEITGVTLRAGTGARADSRPEMAHTGETVIEHAEAPVVEADLPTNSGTLNNEQLTESRRPGGGQHHRIHL